MSRRKTETPLERAERLRKKALADYAKKGTGTAWERALERQHEVWRHEGRAVIFRAPAPFTTEVILKGGKRQGFLGKVGPPDFLGMGEGYGWALEAKSIKRLPFSLKNIEDHQMDDLAVWGRQATLGLPCVGAILLSVHEDGQRWIIFGRDLLPTWRAWKKSKEGGGRAPAGSGSLSLDDLTRLAIPFEETDWLTPTRRAAEFFFDPEDL